jgi:hypothetical protein
VDSCFYASRSMTSPRRRLHIQFNRQSTSERPPSWISIPHDKILRAIADHCHQLVNFSTDLAFGDVRCRPHHKLFSSANHGVQLRVPAGRREPRQGQHWTVGMPRGRGKYCRKFRIWVCPLEVMMSNTSSSVALQSARLKSHLPPRREGNPDP